MLELLSGNMECVHFWNVNTERLVLPRSTSEVQHLPFLIEASHGIAPVT